MKLAYWIKFEHNPNIELFVFEHMEQFFFDLREAMLRRPDRYGPIEWMQRKY